MKADDLLEGSEKTEFDYLRAKVDVLQEQVELMAKILKQENLVLKEETSPFTDIEDEVWKKLEA